MTLTGFVPGYIDKVEAEDAAKRIAGVANDIEVRLPGIDERPDPKLAREAVAAIKRHLPFSAPHIKVVVNDGWIMLEGEVSWNHVREKAEEAVRRLTGVKGITNAIRLKPKFAPAEIKRKIEEALERNAEIDAKRIMVEAHGGRGDPQGRLRVATQPYRKSPRWPPAPPPPDSWRSLRQAGRPPTPR